MDKISIEDIKNVLNAEIIAGNNIRVESEYVDSIATDSRQNIEGKKTMFVALTSLATDGHLYIKNAYENNIRIFLVSKDENELEMFEDAIYIKVQNTDEAIFVLASWYRNKYNIPIIAITGSVGKTTTKDIVLAVLSEKYNVHKTIENFNSYTGVPLTVFELNNSYDISVMELGTDHFGELEATSKVVRPSTVCFTNIGVSHIETFKTRENILEAKCEIFNHTRVDATVIINADNDILQNMLNKKEKEPEYEKLQYKWYGIENTNMCDVYAQNIDIDFNRLTVQFDASIMGQTYAFEIPGVSRHLVYASLTAILVGLEYGMSIMEIRKGLLRYVPSKMRMNILKQDNNVYIIDDTYNASPDSMNSLIDAIDCVTDKEKMVILGDMLELGENSNKLHENIAKNLSRADIKYIYLVGKNMEHAYNYLTNHKDKKIVKYFETRQELEQYLNGMLSKIYFKNILKDIVIGVKASRDIGLEKIVEIICNM